MESKNVISSKYVTTSKWYSRSNRVFRTIAYIPYILLEVKYYVTPVTALNNGNKLIQKHIKYKEIES